MTDDCWHGDKHIRYSISFGCCSYKSNFIHKRKILWSCTVNVTPIFAFVILFVGETFLFVHFYHISLAYMKCKFCLMLVCKRQNKYDYSKTKTARCCLQRFPCLSFTCLRTCVSVSFQLWNNGSSYCQGRRKTLSAFRVMCSKHFISVVETQKRAILCLHFVI